MRVYSPLKPPAACHESKNRQMLHAHCPPLTRLPPLTVFLSRPYLAAFFSDRRLGSEKLRPCTRSRARRCRHRAFTDGVAVSRLGPESASRDVGLCRVVCPSEVSTSRLAAAFARCLRPGDCYCLIGGVGTGKSVFRWVRKLVGRNCWWRRYLNEAQECQTRRSCERKLWRKYGRDFPTEQKALCPRHYQNLCSR